MNDKKNVFIKYIPWIILSGLLLYLLWWRIQIGLTRFFDVDEFSYLHWVANFARGERPYTDFFMFFTPGFLWIFAPLVLLFSHSVNLFIAARIVSFGFFLGMLVFLGLLFGKTRSKQWALLPVVILAFLPMPYDKFLEVRPDNLATLLAFAGLVIQVVALAGKKPSNRLWFWSGFLYMSSLVVFVKTLPFVAVGVGIAFLYAWWGKHITLIEWVRAVYKKSLDSEIKAFLFGLSVPFGVFALWAFSLGDLGAVWYSLTKLPFEANMIGSLGVMEPHLFFFPNGSFYGGSKEVTVSLIVNHFVWVVGIVVGIIRFFTPFITADGDRKNVLIELLMGVTFVLLVFGYIQFFPLKHSQYLIPIAIFISYYSADWFMHVFRWVYRKTTIIGLTCVLVFISYWIATVTVQVNTIKLSWSNTAQLEQTKILLSYIEPDAQVLDLEGRMLFWKDAYFICCVKFGLFMPFLTQNPQPLSSVLEEKRVPYIFQGDTGRLSELQGDDQVYIKAHYAPVSGWSERLWKRNVL